MEKRGKRILLGVAAAAAAVAAVAGIWTYNSWKTGKDPDIIGAALNITPQKEGEWGVEADSTFLITGEKLTEEALRERLSFDPPLEYSLEQDEDGWILTPNEPLPPNRIYAAQLLSPEGEAVRSFAFQTRTDLAVSSVYPENGSNYVETATGIEVAFNATGVRLSEGFSIEPAVKGRFEEGIYSSVFIPEEPLEGNCTYRVTLSGDLRAEDGRTLGEDYVFSFTTANDSGRDSYEDLSLRNGFVSFFQPTDPFTMQLSSGEDMRGASFRLEVYRYPDCAAYAAAIRDHDRFEEERVGPVVPWQADTAPLTLAASAEGELDIDDGFGYRSSVTLPDPLPEGYYIAVLTGKSPSGYDQLVQMLFQVSNLSIYTQSSDGETLVWLNDPAAGTPLKGMECAVEGPDGTVYAARTATGEDGIAFLTIKDAEMAEQDQIYLSRNPGWMQDNLYLSLFNGEECVYFAPVQTTKKTSPLLADQYGAALYMDREIYHAQDTIRFWGVLRSLHGAALPEKVSAVLETPWPRAEVSSVELAVGADGTFSGEMPVESLVMGWYGLSITDGSPLTDDDGGWHSNAYASHSVQVEEFTKPPFVITLTHSKSWYYANEPIDVEIRAAYYDGTPVAGGRLRLTGDGIAELQGGNTVITLDESGRASFSGTWTPGGESEVSTWPASCWFSAVSADAENVYISGNSSVQIVASRYIAELETSAPGVVDIRAALLDTSRMESDWRGSSYDHYAGAPADVPMEVEITRRRRERIEDGSYYDSVTKQTVTNYRYEWREEKVGTYPVQVSGGKAQLTDLPFALPEDDASTNYEIRAYFDGGFGYRVQAYCFWRNQKSEEPEYAFFPGGDVDEENDPRRVKPDGDIVLRLYDGEQAASNAGRVLYTAYQRGLLSHGVFTGAEERLPFTGELQPGVRMAGAYFDGKNVFAVGQDTVRVDYTEKTLSVSVKAGKESYRPGETAELRVSLRDTGGNPVAGKAAVGVVDESVFALAAQELDLAAELYALPDLAYVIQSTRGGANDLRKEASSMDAAAAGDDGNPYTGGMGTGGEKGGVQLRADFKDTALFETVDIGPEGEAVVELTLPDNVTEWRLTAAAVTADYQAGNGRGAAVSILPFTVRPIVSDSYLEGDDIWISLLGTGTQLGSEAAYTVELSGGETQQAQGKVGERTAVHLGRLPAGEYTLTLTGKSGEYADAVEETFSVAEKGLIRRTAQDLALEELAQINAVRYPVTVTLYDESMAAYMKGLEVLSGMDSERTEIFAAAYGARLLSSEHFGGDMPQEKRIRNIQEGQGVSILPASGPDAGVTAKLLAAAPNLIHTGQAKEYLRGVLRDAACTPDDRIMACMGLAALREPVLLDVRRMAEDLSLTRKQKLYLGSALALLGDMENASVIYAANAPGTDAPEDEEGAALLLAALCGHPDTENLMLSLCDKVAKKDEARKEPVTLEMLAYLNRFEVPKGTVRVTYQRDGEKVTEDIEGFKTLSFGRTALEEAGMTAEGGSVRALVHYDGILPEEAGNTDAVITKTVEPVTGEMSMSALAKVTLDVTLPEDAPAGAYVLTDRIPAGMRYLEMNENRWQAVTDGLWGLTEVEGQTLRQYLYVTDESGVQPRDGNMPEMNVAAEDEEAAVPAETMEEPVAKDSSWTDKINPGTDEPMEPGAEESGRHFSLVYYVNCVLPGEYVSLPVTVEHTDGGFYAKGEEFTITVR